MFYLLFSDNTWNCVDSYEEIEAKIKNHWWSFPLDVKGDSRRFVRILTDVGIEEVRKNL